MSRVIGGSSSFEAYTRMLEEIKQKRDEQKAEQVRNSDKINAYKQQEEKQNTASSAVSTSTQIDTYA